MNDKSYKNIPNYITIFDKINLNYVTSCMKIRKNSCRFNQKCISESALFDTYCKFIAQKSRFL